jgi:hypothetical protein
MSIPGFDLYKGVPFEQINGRSNYLYIDGDEIGVYREGASNEARNPEQATLGALRDKVEELCGKNRNDLELRTLAAFINRKIVAYNQSGFGIKVMREVQIPQATVSCSSHPKWEGPAMVIGVWQPGVPEKVITVAIDPHDLQAIRKQIILNQPINPDFEGDIMQIPNEKLGSKKYTKIVFQGCCPVTTAMGAMPCKGQGYPKVDATLLAQKLKGLISERGGFIFFRHCVESAHQEGTLDPSQRQRFIQSFQDVGMQLMKPEDLNSSCLVGQYAPDPTIPDPHPIIKDKWDFDKGGMIFYMPPEENR